MYGWDYEDIVAALVSFSEGLQETEYNQSGRWLKCDGMESEISCMDVR